MLISRSGFDDQCHRCEFMTLARIGSRASGQGVCIQIRARVTLEDVWVLYRCLPFCHMETALYLRFSFVLSFSVFREDRQADLFLIVV